MAFDTDYSQQSNPVSLIVSGTKIYRFQPGAVYAITLGAATGAPSAASFGYDVDGTNFKAYPDDPGLLGGGLEIEAPPSGMVQIAFTGGTAPGRVFSFARVVRN